MLHEPTKAMMTREMACGSFTTGSRRSWMRILFSNQIRIHLPTTRSCTTSSRGFIQAIRPMTVRIHHSIVRECFCRSCCIACHADGFESCTKILHILVMQLLNRCLFPSLNRRRGLLPWKRHYSVGSGLVLSLCLCVRPCLGLEM